ncbi:MAG: DegV family protein [Oscillospiraceae bacterium]|nr:DegV family protein [Oscillospiraceae bacterium]
MAVQLILDSTADLCHALQGKYPFAPLTLRFGEEEYLDGVEITRQEFYEKLTTNPHHPTTSQAGPDTWEKLFSQLSTEDSAVVITIGSNLSGTYQSACIAAEDYENIHVVDSGTTTIGIGILAEYAEALIAAGMSAEQVAASLREKALKVRLYAVMDTLEYLKKGGRVGAAAAVAGSLLQIKPMIQVDNFRLDTLDKVRGAKLANTRLAEKIIKDDMDPAMPVLLGYTGSDSKNMEAFMTQTGHTWLREGQTAECAVVGSVVGVHAGPGAWAVAFFTK